MKTRAEPAFHDLVAVPWGAGRVLGHVHEVYGRPSRRYVVVRLTSELSGYVVAEETTVTFPLEDIRTVDHRQG